MVPNSFLPPAAGEYKPDDDGAVPSEGLWIFALCSKVCCKSLSGSRFFASTFPFGSTGKNHSDTKKVKRVNETIEVELGILKKNAVLPLCFIRNTSDHWKTPKITSGMILGPKLQFRRKWRLGVFVQFRKELFVKSVTQNLSTKLVKIGSKIAQFHWFPSVLLSQNWFSLQSCSGNWQFLKRCSSFILTSSSQNWSSGLRSKFAQLLIKTLNQKQCSGFDGRSPHNLTNFFQKWKLCSSFILKSSSQNWSAGQRPKFAQLLIKTLFQKQCSGFDGRSPHNLSNFSKSEKDTRFGKNDLLIGISWKRNKINFFSTRYCLKAQAFLTISRIKTNLFYLIEIDWDRFVGWHRSRLWNTSSGSSEMIALNLKIYTSSNFHFQYNSNIKKKKSINLWPCIHP